MENIYVDWSYLKDMIDNGNALFKFTEYTKKYAIHVQDEQLVYYTEIFKDTTGLEGVDITQNTTDKTDFETNYKSFAASVSKPRGQKGIPKILVSTDVDDQSMYIAGSKGDITGASNIVDSNFGEEVKLQGVNVNIKNADDGDTMDFEIGYMDATPAWVTVKVFGKAIPVCDDPGWVKYKFKSGAVSVVPATVKARLIYNQVDNTTTKKVVIHYITYK